MTPQSGVTEKPRPPVSGATEVDPDDSGRSSADSEQTPAMSAGPKTESDGIPRPLTRNERTRLATPIPSASAPVLNSPALRPPTMRSRAPRSATPPSTTIRSKDNRSVDLGNGPAVETEGSKSPAINPPSMAETRSIPSSLATKPSTPITLSRVPSGPVAPVLRQSEPTLLPPTNQEPVLELGDQSRSNLNQGATRLDPAPELIGFDSAKSSTGWEHPNQSKGGRAKRNRVAISIFALAVVLIVLGVMFIPSPLQGRFRGDDSSLDVQSTDRESASPLITRPPRDSTDSLIEQPSARQPFVADEDELDGAQPVPPEALPDQQSSTDAAARIDNPKIVGPGTGSTPQTTTIATTTTSIWVEPTVEPREQWTDSGNGVALPDILFKIRFCESTNNYESANGTSSARGAYQFLTMSWDWYGHAASYGVASANLATPAQQDQAALKTFEKDGARPWAESRACWDNPNIDSRYREAKPKATPTTAPATTAPTSSSVPASSETSASQTTVTTTTQAPSTTTTTTATTTTTTTTETTPTSETSTSSTPESTTASTEKS